MPPPAPAAVAPEAVSGLPLFVFALGFSLIAFCGPESCPSSAARETNAGVATKS
jgi:hypothetical protein